MSIRGRGRGGSVGHGVGIDAALAQLGADLALHGPEFLDVGVETVDEGVDDPLLDRQRAPGRCIGIGPLGFAVNDA